MTARYSMIDDAISKQHSNNDRGAFCVRAYCYMLKLEGKMTVLQKGPIGKAPPVEKLDWTEAE